MTPEAQARLQKGFEEAGNKLKAVTDFLNELADIDDCRRHSLSRWVIRARLLRGTPTHKPGDLRMTNWNAHWRSCSVPLWFQKACRHWLTQNHLWTPYGDPVQQMLSKENIFKILFENVGTIDTGAMRPVVLQPPENYDETAEEFARQLCLRLEIIRPGIWDPGITTTYIFRYGP